MPYTFQVLPTGKVDILENGTSIKQGGQGFDASYAASLGYDPTKTSAPASTGTQYAPPPATPMTYTADAVTSPTQPYKTPGTMPTTPDDYYSKIIASIPSSADIVGQTTGAQTDAQNTAATLKQKILDTLTKLGGKGAAQATAEQNAGLPDLQKQLTDITSQMTAIDNQAKAIPLQDQQDVEGRGVTAGGLAPIEAGELRRNAIKKLGLSSVAATLQGNIALANDTVARTISAEFDPLQNQLDYLKTFYTMNQGDMAAADKTAAAQIAAKLAERQDKIDQNKSDRENVLKAVNAAAAAGAPAAVISQALAADLDTATKLLAPYMKDKNNLISVGAGTTLYDPVTGKSVYTAPKETDTSTTLSQAKQNSGAVNAGIPLAEFEKLDADTQNYFANGFTTFAAQQKLISTGQRTKEEVAKDIQDSTSLTEKTKTILLQLLGVNPAEASTGGGGGGFWNSVGSVLGGALNTARGLIGI